MGDKVEARQIAINAGVPVVPGTDEPIQHNSEIRRFIEDHGLPVIVKVSFSLNTRFSTKIVNLGCIRRWWTRNAYYSL